MMDRAAAFKSWDCVTASNPSRARDLRGDTGQAVSPLKPLFSRLGGVVVVSVSSPVEWRDDSSEPSELCCFRKTQGLTAGEVREEASLGKAWNIGLSLIFICG